MSPQPFHQQAPDGDALLTPREVAGLFGVRTTTIARWAREGRLEPIRTPGGHRRYQSADVRRLLEDVKQGEDQAGPDPVVADDAVRMYEQGWSIRQVAERFGYSYTGMRRILSKRVTLRGQGEHAHGYPFARPGQGRGVGSQASVGGRDFP